MKLIKPSFEILSTIDGEEILKEMEIAARTCYKSEGKIEYESNWPNAPTAASARKLLTKLIERKHFAMLEFGGSITVKFVVDRGMSHEMVRHRIASFAQESTRYCNYGNDDHMQFILPPWVDEKQLGTHDSLDITTNIGPDAVFAMNEIEKNELLFLNSCAVSELTYRSLLENKWAPQQARSVLPNSLKTEINVAANIREWRHIFSLRCAKTAHPQMREIMIPLLKEFKNMVSILFDDLNFEL